MRTTFRAELLALGVELGHPRLWYTAVEAVDRGPAAWQAFATRAGRPRVLAARAAAKGLLGHNLPAEGLERVTTPTAP